MMRKGLFFGLLLLIFGQAFAQEPISLWEGYDVSHGKQVTLISSEASNTPT